MLRSSRLQRLNYVDILVIVAVVLCWQFGGIVRMVGSIGLGYLCTLYINLYNAEGTDKIGIFSVYTYAAHRLVTRYGFGVEVTDIGDVAIGLY
jgi:hypothetical protein